jgi:uncharacterized protein YuzE
MAAVMYDREADVLYVELAAGDGPETEGEEVHPGVMLLFDAAGRIIAIEISSASKILAPGAIEKIPAAADSSRAE